MRFGQLSKDRPEKVHVQVRNDEASLAIGVGEPCCLVMDGTRDGLDVVTATTGAGAKATTLLAGVANSSIAASERGMVQVYGVIDNLKLIRQTRAASTDSYQSFTAIAIGDKLQVQTVGNGFSRAGAGAASDHKGYAAAGATYASGASSASTTSDSSTEVTTAIKAFLRIM